MNCMIDVVDNSIEIVQGDYLSCAFTITDEEGNALQNVKEVLFSSTFLNFQKELDKTSDSEFVLNVDSTTTSQFNVGTCTYDLTITFNDEVSPITVIYNAKFVVLKKENTINVSSN